MKRYIKSSVDFQEFKNILEGDFIWEVIDKVEERINTTVEYRDMRTKDGVMNYFDAEYEDGLYRVKLSDRELYDLFSKGGIDTIVEYISSRL